MAVGKKKRTKTRDKPTWQVSHEHARGYFADLKEPPVFTTKPKKETPIPEEAIARIAEDNNFPSRQAPKAPKEPRRKARRYRTGRNQQLNIKATNETIEKFIKVADDRHVPLGELLRLALDALDRAGGAER